MPEQIYQLDPAIDPMQLETSLSDTFAALNSEHHQLKQYILDSADWRLFNKGLYLLACPREGHYQLKLYRSDNNQLISQAEHPNLPHFHHELGSAKLAHLLAPILDIRALLDQVTLNTQRHRLWIADKHDKIQAELLIENYQPNSAARNISHQIHQLRHVSYTGYDKLNQKISNALLKSEGVLPQQHNPITTLISELQSDNQYSGKQGIQLVPGARADVEAKRLLKSFYEVMRSNEQGVIDDIDSEFLHDFRIAVRRSRSLLSQVKQIFPQKQLNSFQAGLAKLGAITTPQRDFDVMQLQFDEFRDMVPKKMRADLDPIYDYAIEQRRLAYQNTCTYLKGKQYQTFCDRWSRFLDQPPAANTRLANAQRPTLEVANERIWKIYRRSLKEGVVITDLSPADDVHELRKTCKKLRYLMEFYQSLYDKKSIRRLIKTLKHLQDNLGTYQDLHVQLAFFSDLKSELAEKGELGTNTEHALDALGETLDQRQHQTREEFYGRFDEYSSKQHQGWFRELFKAKQS